VKKIIDNIRHVKAIKLVHIRLIARLCRVFLLALLTACATNQRLPYEHSPAKLAVDLICKNPAQYAKSVVGDGHCVSLIKKCSGAPDTISWFAGDTVLGNRIPAGTIIATFKNNRYPNRHGHHAAVYIRQDKQGIWVWDQWLGKAVHQRLIRIRNDGADPGNTAQAYKVVRIR